MSTFHQILNELASTNVPILFVGEAGVGKRNAARRVHDLSPWADSPFVECSGRSTSEAEIKNVFGGVENTPSTVYFDSVEALSAASQKALLACIDGSKVQPRWPRIIGSGSAELEVEVRSGRFREDLYYKLSGICVTIPPLRYRKDELIALAETYLDKYAIQFNRPKPEISPTLNRYLQAHPWMGNLRELEDAMRTVVAVGDVRVAIAALQSANGNGNGREKKNGTESVSLKQVGRAASQKAEGELILKVLSRTNWNRKQAAEELRISYKALLYKLKGINTSSMAVGSGGKSA